MRDQKEDIAMTLYVTTPAATVSRWRKIAAALLAATRRAFVSYRTRRALSALSDMHLRDVGLSRGDIDFVATSAMPRRLRRDIGLIRMVFVAAIALPMLLAAPEAGLAQESLIRRGQYLVTLGGCNDCHTPGYFFGKPDMARFLGGSEVGFEIPGLGVFHGPNLTPDSETGLGTWSTEQIATAIAKGRRPDGRELAPIMPWHAFAKLTSQDVRAIAVYLKSLPPVKNKVPGPFGPGEQPTSFVMKIVPPQPAATEGAAPK
jgi:mono/diheme cytochrome c family protein